MKVIYLSKNYIYINEDGRVVRKELSHEKGIVTSSIGYKHILNVTFKLPKDIEKEMLEIEAEKYVFTEGSLDYNKEYKINYIFREYDDYYNVEAFVVETEVLKKEFEKYLKIFKYIDFISAKPFVFKSYYEIINDKPKNDAFIYFSEDEAFLSCFEKGKFVFVKSITKLSALAKQLNITVEQTVELLQKNGLNSESYEDEQTYSVVESFFSQFFMKVNNLINYSISYYGLSKIERIFFYSSFEIKGLYENYVDFWNLSGIEFKKLEINSEYDPFDYTALIYNSKHYENEHENFTIFPKPKPLYKTKSGIFAILSLILLLLISGDALYKYNLIQKQEKKIMILKSKIARKSREYKMLQLAIKKYKNKLSKLQSENSDIQKQISDIYDKILYLNDIQKKPLLSNTFADLVNTLKKYDLKIASLDKQGGHIDLIIISKFDNSSDVARLMKELYKKGYKNITSEKIENTLGVYLSKVSYDE